MMVVGNHTARKEVPQRPLHGSQTGRKAAKSRIFAQANLEKGMDFSPIDGQGDKEL